MKRGRRGGRARFPAHDPGLLADRGHAEEAVDRLKMKLLSRGKEVYFKVFEARVRFDEGKPTDYKTLSGEFGRSVYDIRNYLTAARKVFRESLLDLASERSEDPMVELKELGLSQYVS